VIGDQPSGLGWMPDGSMLIVSMTKRQVLRRTVRRRILYPHRPEPYRDLPL
jgi:hypothetical protein